MKTKLTSRHQDLNAEYQKGQERLAALEQETASVRASMLRISGAIQILEELLETDKELSTPKNENGVLLKNGLIE